MFMKLATLCFLFHVFCYHVTVALVLNKNHIVTIDQGVLEGKPLVTKNGFSYNVFYAIPYAAPPIGTLRFKDPEPPKKWNGIRNAKTQGPTCFQLLMTNDLQYKGVEDCLQLNVYTPSKRTEKSRYPVMYWIHGGAFIGGTATDFDPKFLVKKGIVVVTANYRPGFLGFMSIKNTDVPGNAGLKDMLMVLKWIQKNICYFGEDPNNVTAFGHSAGSASLHFLLLSPLSKGLFHRAIIQSGVSINEWPLQRDPKNVTDQLRTLVGIEENDNKKLLTVLQNKPIESVAQIVKQIPFTDGRITPFRPIVEGYSPNALVLKDPKISMETGEFMHIPTLNGYVNQEAIMFLFLIQGLNGSTVDDIIPDFYFYIPIDIREHLSEDQEKAIKEKIKSFYFPDNRNITERFIDLNSDHQFIKDLYKSTSIFSKYNPNTYLYEFSYNGILNVNKFTTQYEYQGAAHGDELGYLFDMYEGSLKPSELDYQTRNRMVEMWSNFAKFGNPTPRMSSDVNIIWKPVTKNKLNCLLIQSNLTLVQSPLRQRMEFWRNLENMPSKKKRPL